MQVVSEWLLSSTKRNEDGGPLYRTSDGKLSRSPVLAQRFPSKDAAETYLRKRRKFSEGAYDPVAVKFRVRRVGS